MNAFIASRTWLILLHIVAATTTASFALAAVPAAPNLPPGQVTLGSQVDIAPWGERVSWAQGKDVGIYWEDPRDICQVSVTFHDSPPNPDSVRLQWWQSRWPENRIPRDRLSGAGESGWLNIGDGYQGRWCDGDVALSASSNTWTYSFKPINQKEYRQLKNFPAQYRTTMKLRLLFNSTAPAIESFRVFSDSVWKSADLAIEWGGSSEASQIWDGHLELFNGYADHIAPLNQEAAVTLSPDGHWKSEVKGRTAGIRARVWFTESQNVNTFDKTVVTVRAKQQSFSFDASSVAAGNRVFVPMYGVLVRRAIDPTNYATAFRQWKTQTAKPLYERVFDESEQTFARAWADMPPKRQFYFPLGCEGGRQRFGVDPDGSVFCKNDRIDQPRGKDTPRRKWGGNNLRYKFGLPDSLPAKRWIEDDCLPIVHAQWDTNGIRYTQTAFATRFEDGSLGWPDMRADDTTVLMMRITCENTGGQPATALLTGSLLVDQFSPLSITPKGLVFTKVNGEDVLRYALEGPITNWTARSSQLRYSESLPAGGKSTFIFKIPFITLDQPSELTRLENMSFDRELDRVKSFWVKRADASCQIRVPVKEISNFYRADVSHLMINCGREVNADRLMARVGGFSYGVYGNESCMMITDLDRRGFHSEAERCLETFLHYQGTSPLPGEYLSQDAVFNGAGGWESGGYNQHHGWILWAMAEHYWYSGDRDWLNRNAPKLIKACQWIINERSRSQAFPASSLRGIERGLLPHGSLEDISDWRCWLSNNLFSWWGMDAMAKALVDINHPQGKILQAAAEAYRSDLLTAFKEAMVRSPMVSLRDGSSIPAMPSEVHRRGRTYGWITTTLEGPIYLIRTGALSPQDPLALCIMQDYEDNLYLSQQYGYPPEYIKNYWFSRGGFSMQPNLLCSPHPYLMRDEIKHYLRAYFNAFASAYYPNTKMLTEHPLPTLADWRGDHYKSSDESNSTYWLRLMFVDERDDNLCLGMALPRAWLSDGETPSIERSSTRFGPMSLRYESHAAQGSITAVVDPPLRRVPKQTFLRFRHPLEKPIQRVTIDGKSWDKFDAKRELIELPILTSKTIITAYYQ